MPLLRAALTLLAFVFAMLGATAHADPPPKAPRSPGQQAIDAGEDQAIGSTIPELDDRPALPLAGKPIRRVEVEIGGGRWTTRPAIKSVRLGEPLTLEVGRRAMREVLETGQFARASVETFADGDGAGLRLHLLPKRLIATIQLTGGALETGDTLDAAQISEGGELTAPHLDQVATRLRTFYAQHGFPSAHVLVDAADTDKPDRVVVSIVIQPGSPQTIKERIFVIDPRADQEVGDLKLKYRLSKGARVDERSMTEADRELVEVLKQRGFLRAEVRHAVRSVGPSGYLYIYLDPGPRLVPAFDGNRAFDADQLTEALNLEKAPDGRISELLERLRAFYITRGFLDVEISATEQGKAKEPVHYLLFSIREHAQVRVVRRVFPCLGDAIKANDMGDEIEAVLREELPGTELFAPGDPRTIGLILGALGGRRALPADLNPLMTYAPETYERALKHLRDLLHSKGYLNAQVGPVSVLRATCSRRSRAGECIPVPPPGPIKSSCPKDALDLPLPEPPVPDNLICRPDPAHNVECSPELTLRIPINLGPQTMLYDLAFEGNRSHSEKDLAKIADLSPGSPLSNVELDAARARILDTYRRDGYAYAEVRTAIEPSPDRTRARVRFSVSERDQVVVTGFVVKGATRTDEALILRRVALRRGRPFRLDQVRSSEERIAALGTFSSVSIALEDPEVPQRRKRVVITVVEQGNQYVDIRAGFSSGEGFRGTFEYGHRNLGGRAITLTLRFQASYVPDLLIIDREVRKNYANIPILLRAQRRNTLDVTFPEIGLGPLVSVSLQGIDVRDNQRDFGLTKDAGGPTLTYRPLRQITTQFGASVERNDVTILHEQARSTIRIPEGLTLAISQRAAFTWDFRDNPLNPTKGGLVSTTFEHVDAFPLGEPTKRCKADKEGTEVVTHLLRLSGKISGYIKLPWKVVLALSLSAGYNFQLTKDTKKTDSETYPDRFFFLGGGDSIRSFLADSVVPQDQIDKIRRRTIPDPCNPLATKPYTINDVTIRGGNLSVNPRAEFRIPITDLFQAGVFLDAGNLWQDASLADRFVLRYGVGAGIRFMTPVGPLALDFGLNPDRHREWEDIGAIHFSIGLF